MRVRVPITVGVWVSGVFAEFAVPVLSEHAVNVPVPVLAGVIVPPGALSVPVSVSVTVHVQVVESFTGIDPDAQLTPVVVVRGRTVSAKALAVLLPAWIRSVADTAGLQPRAALPSPLLLDIDVHVAGVLVLS